MIIPNIWKNKKCSKSPTRMMLIVRLWCLRRLRLVDYQEMWSRSKKAVHFLEEMIINHGKSGIPCFQTHLCEWLAESGATFVQPQLSRSPDPHLFRCFSDLFARVVPGNSPKTNGPMDQWGGHWGRNHDTAEFQTKLTSFFWREWATSTNNMYPLLIEQSYWKGPLIVALPTGNGDFP